MKICNSLAFRPPCQLEGVRKQQGKPATIRSQTRGPRESNAQDKTKTSAKSVAIKQRDNLTLRDWLTIFAFIDAHPTLSQEHVVDHFSSLEKGALKFTQSTWQLAWQLLHLSTGANSAVELSRVLHRFRAEVSREYMHWQNMKQSRSLI